MRRRGGRIRGGFRRRAEALLGQEGDGPPIEGNAGGDRLGFIGSIPEEPQDSPAEPPTEPPEQGEARRDERDDDQAAEAEERADGVEVQQPVERLSQAFSIMAKPLAASRPVCRIG